MTLTLYGYQVLVRGAADAFHVTCPELPQVSVADRTIGRALSRAEQAIGAFLMGWSIRS
jgi:septum formation inhibitor-activating ATPase MinD